MVLGRHQGKGFIKDIISSYIQVSTDIVNIRVYECEVRE